MTSGRSFWTAIALVALALPAHADDWTTSRSGGSDIEIPSFFLDGPMRALMTNGEDFGTAYEPDEPIALRQYRTRATGRPYVYLAQNIGVLASQITYSVDKDTLGVMSGYAREDEIFYAVCRSQPNRIICIDLFYAADRQAEFGPMVERIAKSFIEGTTSHAWNDLGFHAMSYVEQ